jgi:hypothetical protein
MTIQSRQECFDTLYRSTTLRTTGRDERQTSSTKSLSTTKIIQIIVIIREPLYPAACFRLHLKLTCKRRFAVNTLQTVNR